MTHCGNSPGHRRREGKRMSRGVRGTAGPRLREREGSEAPLQLQWRSEGSCGEPAQR